MLHPELKKNFFLSSAVSFFLFSVYSALLCFLSPLLRRSARHLWLVLLLAGGRFGSGASVYAQDKTTVVVVKGKIVYTKSKASVEGVTIEVKKDGAPVTQVTSDKKGKYTFQIEVSTANPKNDYVINISKEGTVPKLLTFNAYLTQTEFGLHPFVRYSFDMDMFMIETTAKDVVMEKPSGKVKWDYNQHIFDFDQVYAKIIQKEEEKIATNPDQYLKDIAKKKKKADDALAKKKTAEDGKLKAAENAKLKAEEDAKRLAEQKAKEEADRIEKQNMEAMNNAILKKKMEDSLAKLAAQNEKVEIKKIEKPVLQEDVSASPVFNGADVYDLKAARKSQMNYKANMNKEKSKNLFAKYETNNTLTSLLNVVDEHEKKMKKQ